MPSSSSISNMPTFQKESLYLLQCNKHITYTNCHFFLKVQQLSALSLSPCTRSRALRLSVLSQLSAFSFELSFLPPLTPSRLTAYGPHSALSLELSIFHPLTLSRLTTYGHFSALNFML